MKKRMESGWDKAEGRYGEVCVERKRGIAGREKERLPTGRCATSAFAILAHRRG